MSRSRTIHSRLVQPIFDALRTRKGLAPAPTPADLLRLLRGDGTWQTISNIIGTKEIWFGPQASGADGAYRERGVGTSGAFQYTGAFPLDFDALVSIELVYINGGANPGAGADIDLLSEYGAVGEAMDAHTESDVTTTYTIVANNSIGSIDLAPVFSTPSAGDLFGVEVDNNGLGGPLNVLGVRLRYTT